jgi:Na+/melibiose symporter-like transporter
MLGVIGQFTGIFGTIFYEKQLKDIEVRKIMFWATICSIISSCSSYAFALRLNKLIGIPDIMFIILTDTIFGVLSLAMNTLPTLALFAKVTPKRIEGTIFAFLTGTTNLANSVISPMIGVWINTQFVGVTADDLSKYKTLCLVSLLTSFLGFFILPLIPLKEDIQRY